MTLYRICPRYHKLHPLLNSIWGCAGYGGNKVPQAKSKVHYSADVLLEEGPSFSLSQDEQASI